MAVKKSKPQPQAVDLGPVTFEITLLTDIGRMRLEGDIGAMRRLRRELDEALTGYEQTAALPATALVPIRNVSARPVGTFKLKG